MPLTLRYVARSDVGLIREGNEDSGYAGPYLLAVADGMGGHAAGEVASQAAIEELVQAEQEDSRQDPLGALSDAIQGANDRIRQLIADDPTREGMGTTVTALLWTGTSLSMGHIGDSRAYLLRDGGIVQLSHDHTFVQSLVDEGRITMEEAGVHPARSLILKALQGQGPVEPDLETIDIQPGDRLLVCSDGLSGVVSDDTLAETMSTVEGLDGVADELIRLALAAGAPDNITLIVADVVETDTPRSADDTAEAFLVGAAAGDQPPGKERPQRRRTTAALRVLLGAEEKTAEPDDPEAIRYAPRPPRRYRWVRPVVVLLAVVLIGWAGMTLADNWVRSQYYVGQNDGQVAIFQGLSQEIGPVRLSELHEIPGDLPVDSLPTLYKEQVESTITADDARDAEDIVISLRQRACDAAEEERAATEPDLEPTTDPSPDPTTVPGTDGTTTPPATREPTSPGSTGRPTATANAGQIGAGSTDAPSGDATVVPDEPSEGETSDVETPGAETPEEDASSDDWVSPDIGLDCTGVR